MQARNFFSRKIKNLEISVKTLRVTVSFAENMPIIKIRTLQIVGGKVRLSIILIILLLCLVGLLMVISAVGMKEKDAFAVRILFFVLGIVCIIIGLYILFAVYLPQYTAAIMLS